MEQGPFLFCDWQQSAVVKGTRSHCLQLWPRGRGHAAYSCGPGDAVTLLIVVAQGTWSRSLQWWPRGRGHTPYSGGPGDMVTLLIAVAQGTLLISCCGKEGEQRVLQQNQAFEFPVGNWPVGCSALELPLFRLSGASFSKALMFCCCWRLGLSPLWPGCCPGAAAGDTFCGKPSSYFYAQQAFGFGFL